MGPLQCRTTARRRVQLWNLRTRRGPCYRQSTAGPSNLSRDNCNAMRSGALQLIRNELWRKLKAGGFATARAAVSSLAARELQQRPQLSSVIIDTMAIVKSSDIVEQHKDWHSRMEDRILAAAHEPLPISMELSFDFHPGRNFPRLLDWRVQKLDTVFESGHGCADYSSIVYHTEDPALVRPGATALSPTPVNG